MSSATPAMPASTLSPQEKAPAPKVTPQALPPVSPHSTGKRSRTVVVNHDALAAAGMISAKSENTAIAEEFRFIKRPLLLKASGESDPDSNNRHRNLIMVCSSRSGDGKTFSAVNLAMSIALERDLTVMLVDADLAKPSVTGVLGIEADLGLIDLISDDTLDMSDVLLRTDIDNLTVLPAGRPHPLATELLASDKMEKFIDDVAVRYPDRIVIFDSAPALMNSIPGVLSLYVGQIVFVVQADKSTQEQVNAALGIVDSCDDIYLLLNKVRKGKHQKDNAYYGYSN